MDILELKTGTINPERLGALQNDLKNNFNDVRLKFFRADLPKGDQTRPKNIFPSDHGTANFVTLKVNRRDCLEFYKTAFRSYALIYTGNFGEMDAKRVKESLQRKGFMPMPEMPKVVMPPMPVPKSFTEQLADSFRDIISKVQAIFRS